MTHEFKEIIDKAHLLFQLNKKMVLATVVKLEGSSYRRPGVRMLISDSGEMFGAVSGGCVEKEILLQSQSVFTTNQAKLISYDGRYRLGCEGILYILLEPFQVNETFFTLCSQIFSERKSFQIESYFENEVGNHENMGSQLVIKSNKYSFGNSIKSELGQSIYIQNLGPIFQLYIIGAEHDAVQLCKSAHLLGWKVIVVADANESKTIGYFAGASQLISENIENLVFQNLDSQSAVMVMTHSFNKDIQYLMALQNIRPAYFGLLGPAHRRERILDKLLELNPDLSLDFIEQIHGPAGINIGAESASEIAISILAEILSVLRQQNPILLKDKNTSIHA